MAHLSSQKRQRGPYKLPERIRTIQDMRDLILQGYNYNAIMQQLHIPHRTFYRYLSALFEDDRRLLAENISDEEFLNQMTICRDRLLEDRRTLQEWMKDPNFHDKVAAMHLSAEIAAAVFRIYESGPSLLAARHQFPRTSLTAKGTTGAKLVLKRRELEEEDEYYDELDEEEEDEVARKSSSLSAGQKQEQEAFRE